MKSLGQDDTEVVKEAAWGLGCLGRTDAVPALCKLLGHDRPEVRQYACEALGLLGDGRAVGPLLERVKDPVPDVRGQAVWALGGLGDQKAIPVLLKSLGDDELYTDTYGEREIIGWQAAASIASMGKVALEPLIEATRSERRLVQENAARALGYLEDSDAVEPLIELLEHPPPEVCRATINALGALRATGAVDKIVTFLKHKHPQLRWSAVLALGQIGESSVAPALIQLLQEEDEDIRYLVTGALQNLGDDRAIAPLIACLSEGSRVSEGACRALGEMGIVQAAPAIVKLADSKAAELRHAAIGAMGNIPTPETEAALIAATKASDPETRGAACIALSRHEGGPAVVKALERLLVDASKEVRHEATRALEKLTGRKYS
jgi:HEAT repeat protein